MEENILSRLDKSFKVATRSPTKRDSCVVEPSFCPSCLSKISSSEPWFPYPPPLYIPNACGRCGTLQAILHRLPRDVTVFADILKLASFAEVVNFNEILNEANGKTDRRNPLDLRLSEWSLPTPLELTYCRPTHRSRAGRCSILLSASVHR